MTVNGKDFIQQLVDKHGYTKKSAAMLVEDFLDMIIDNFEAGNEVQFHGFGRFVIERRAARRCINPATGEQMDLPEHFVPRFHPGTNVKLAVKKYVSLHNKGED